MASRPSALKTFGIIIGVLAAVPVGLCLLWLFFLGIALLVDVVKSPSQTPSQTQFVDTKAKNYVYSRPPLENASNPPDQNFYHTGDRIYFFEDGDGTYSLKSYDLRDGSIAEWTKVGKMEASPVTFAFPPDGESIYAYRSDEGLFLLGKKVAPPIPESCGPERDFFLLPGGEGVLASCLPRGDGSSAISIFLLAPGSSAWSDRSPVASWKDGKLKGYAALGHSIFLLGEAKVHRLNPVRRDIVPVAELKELLKDSAYQPLLGNAGDLLYLAGGDNLFFWDDGSSSFENVFQHASSSSLRFWYDDYESSRVLVQDGEAWIQVVDDASGRKGLGYFRKDETGEWVYRGLMEDVSFVQPVAFAADAIYSGNREGLARREIGLQTCRPAPSSDFRASFDWIPKMVRGGEISGYVLTSAPELCRIEIAGSSLWISFSSENPSNFEKVRVGDRITASVVRWTARGAVIDRVFIDGRDGAAVLGQAPLKNRTLIFTLIALCLLSGIVSIGWSLKRMSQASRVCLARIFETEEQVRSADRLRTVGLAVLALGLLGLTVNLQGRPVDTVSFLEAVSLQVGVFWVPFSILYYVAAANLLKLIPSKPSLPAPAFSPAARSEYNK